MTRDSVAEWTDSRCSIVVMAGGGVCVCNFTCNHHIMTRDSVAEWTDSQCSIVVMAGELKPVGQRGHTSTCNLFTTSNGSWVIVWYFREQNRTLSGVRPRPVSLALRHPSWIGERHPSAHRFGKYCTEWNKLRLSEQSCRVNIREGFGVLFSVESTFCKKSSVYRCWVDREVYVRASFPQHTALFWSSKRKVT